MIAESSQGDSYRTVLLEIPWTLNPGSGAQGTGITIPYGAQVLDFTVQNRVAIDVPAFGGGRLSGWILKTGGGSYTQILKPASNVDPIPQFTKAVWPNDSSVTPSGPTIFINDPSDLAGGAQIAVGVTNFGASGGELVVAYVLYQVAVRDSTGP